MSQKQNDVPDSDQTARPRHSPLEDTGADASSLENLQTSTKSGKHSSVEKLAASRPEFGSSPGANPVPGAFGGSTREEAGLGGPRMASPATNHFKCNDCGRYFNSESELSEHAIECGLAKHSVR